MQNHFLAGVGRTLFIDPADNRLIGVGLTNTDTSFDASIANTELRGGESNALRGKYFHDSNLGLTITDSMFSLDYMAMNLGTNVQSGGLSIKEEQLTVTVRGQLTVTETPIATNGSLIGWYKKPDEAVWKIGTIEGKIMTVPGAEEQAIYCVKYFFNNENAKSVVFKTRYVPKVVHVVVINELFAGGSAEIGSAEKYGRIIVDIPRFQLDGAVNLALTPDSASTVSVSGSALAVESTDSCEEGGYYGTMTQEVYGAKWQDDVIAIAIENADVDLKQKGTETLAVRVVFGNGIAAIRKDNKYFTFAVESKPTSTASGTSVGAHDGKITAGSTPGNCVISVKLDNGPKGLEPAYANVTVA